MRDFRGYGDDLPQADWPGGARIAVSFVLNFEEGAELSIADGDERNEAHYEVQQEVVGAADPCMSSHFDYGTRVAWRRIRDLFGRFGVPITVSACGRAVERSPWLVRDAVERGHEVSCHGWRWETHSAMRPEDERVVIAKAAAAIAAAAGIAPVGWHTRSAGSAATRRLLVEHGGFLYDSDAYDDELPYFVPVGERRHLVIPYAFDTNDMHFHQGQQRFVFGSDFARYTNDSFDWLHREGEQAPRMMSVGLHLRMIGRPGRIAGLEQVLEHMTRKGRVWFARRDAIARHWLARFGRAS